MMQIRKVCEPAVVNPSFRKFIRARFYREKALRLQALQSLIWDTLSNDLSVEVIGAGTRLNTKEPVSDISFEHDGYKYTLVLTERSRSRARMGV